MVIRVTLKSLKNNSVASNSFIVHWLVKKLVNKSEMIKVNNYHDL